MSRIVKTLAAEAATVFAGQTITGTELEAFITFRYTEELGKRQTFQSWMNTTDTLESAHGVVISTVIDGDRLFTFQPINLDELVA